MAGWYDPRLLVQTGIRVAISTIFGQFADKREALAAANAIEPQPFDDTFKFSLPDGDGSFWLDYIADTGDGWNSTYAMARLLAAETLQPQGTAEKLPRGQVLVMGGDQVYPTASREEYDNRLIGPFEEAYRLDPWPKHKRPALFAIPGNHDWYDGLNAFFGLFCRRRVQPKVGIGIARNGKVIGGRQTYQTRSYFAIELPGNWWLWATDSQLEGYIDQPQIDYFQHAAQVWMKPGSNVILCIGEPSWEYVDPDHPELKFKNFSYLERLAGSTPAPKDPPRTPNDAPDRWPAPDTPMNHQLRVVLTGDSHHYARYVEDDRHYITCGGGGAFLHPTHHLKNKHFEWEYPEPGRVYEREAAPYRRSFEIAEDDKGNEALFPSRGTSRLLTCWNLLFPLKNPLFPVALLLAYLLFTWVLHFHAKVSGSGSLLTELGNRPLADAIYNYWRLVITSPAPVALAAVAAFAYRYFADVKNRWGRWLMGLGHAAAQAAAVTVVTCLVVDATSSWYDRGFGTFASIFAASVAAALASGFVFGAYLWFNLLFLNRHWNEGFSSFAHQGYKCFLRLAFTADGELKIYPIGLRKVPQDRGRTLKNPKLAPHLIEPAIVVPAAAKAPVPGA
jgi:hypothetical protein